MSWLPFYREVMQVLSTYETRQDELVQLLRNMNAAGLQTIALNDKVSKQRVGALEEIDPFTFLATFHRTSEYSRTQLWEFLRENWRIAAAVPQNFAGLPVVSTHNSWFIAPKDQRKSDDIAVLWSAFQTARSGGALAPALSTRALQVSQMDAAKFTIGLFWVNADRYLPLDGTMVKYLSRFQIVPNMAKIGAGDLEEYTRVLAQVHQTLGYDHIKISREAWETKDTPVATKRYWAGGHDFGADYGGQQKERFLKDSLWQANFLDSDQKNITNQMRALFQEIQIGDEFAIKGCGADNLRVHAIGRITEILPEKYLLKLDFLPERPLYRGKRPVGAGAGNWTQTLLEVKRPEDIQLIFHGDKIEKAPPKNLPPFPLNQILYGPPGTGKTYSSIARAVEIIDGEVASTREAIVARFEELRAAGRIGFATFHQSFAYEEFVEGLRPILDEDESGAARYQIRDGVFKQMALRALAASLRFPPPEQGSAPTFEQLWDELTRSIDENDFYEIEGLGKARYRLSLSPLGTIYGENVAGNAQKPYTASRNKVREVWEKLPAGEKPSHNRIYAILERGAHTNLIGAIVQEMREIAGKETPASTRELQKAPSFEDAREWLGGAHHLETIEGEAPRFVLIIDEINRGNIAKVFGELITLLEDDKRLGAENELRVTLPHSPEPFGVPRNLYLLGTMNTADKSLALLDIALRRRFEFVELRPDFSDKVCARLDETMRRVLAQLNARLMRVLDREHRLGHAAWRNVATRPEWNAVFARQIVPLLQEYFYNDWDGLRGVLGEGENGKIVRALPPLEGVKSRTRYAWWFDLDDEENASAPDFLAVLTKNFKLNPPPAALPATAPPETTAPEDAAP